MAGRRSKAFKAYPWSKCVRDQMKRYHNKRIANAVCAKIRRSSRRYAH